ncbi:hypothetical protein JCM11641_003733 [Rhodosporidiobolus odoratus]
MLHVILASLALVANSLAQTDHEILVGSNGLTYSPANISAEVGDTVTFVWVPAQQRRQPPAMGPGAGGAGGGAGVGGAYGAGYAAAPAAMGTNHSVTQSSFVSPCEPLLNASTDERGFDSGYVPVSAGATDSPTWTLNISSSTAIWFYCAQANHCQQGMVGSINAATSGNRTFEAFQAAAMGSDQSTPAGSAVASGIGAEAIGAISTVPVQVGSGATASGSQSSGAAAASGSSSASAKSGGNSSDSAAAPPPLGAGLYGTTGLSALVAAVLAYLM